MHGNSDACLADQAPLEQNAEQPFKRLRRFFDNFTLAPLADPESEARIRRQERDQIARELHDSTAQLLVALQLQLSRLNQPSTWKSGQFKAIMGELDAILHELHQEVRALGKPRLHPVGELAQRLKDMGASFAARAGFHVDVDIEDLPDDLSVRESETLYRVAQEALANASRHAHAERACLLVGIEDGVVTLRVSDDGVGLSQPATERFGRGINNMSTRLHEVGGHLTLRNLPRGTLVEAKLRPRTALS